ncbi:MAG: hypothetical protein QOG21_1357 [Actinomycetota bacterium]|jgi:hypothetical protein|nr:hypothetical protein [Actinomycetota bacterium]
MSESVEFAPPSDTKAVRGDDPQDELDHHLGAAAKLLVVQGEGQAAALLADVRSLRYVQQDIMFRISGEERLYEVARAPALWDRDPCRV